MSKNKLEVPRTIPWVPQPRTEPVEKDDDVEPGERKRKEKFRQKTVGDLLVPFATSVVFGAGAAGIAYGLGAKSNGPLLSGSITLLCTFAITGLPVVLTDGPSVLELVETITRVDLDGNGTIGVPGEVVHRYHVIGELRQGVHRIYTDLGIMSEEQAWNWHRFCRDVYNDERQFTGNQAEDAGVDRTWFAEVLVPRWSPRDTKLQLIDPDTVGPKQTMQLRDSGKEMIAAFARIPPTQGAR